jgi:hypothetical protein
MIRKTDFFYECDPGDKMGFPPGYNKKLVIFNFINSFLVYFKNFNNNIIKDSHKNLLNSLIKNFKLLNKNKN